MPPVATRSTEPTPERWPPDQNVVVHRQSRDLLVVLAAGFLLLFAVGVCAAVQLSAIERRLARIEVVVNR